MNERTLDLRILDIEGQIGRWSDAGLRTLNQIPQAFPYATKTVTATYAVEPFVRVVLADATAGTFTVTLPSAYARAGQQPLFVKRTSAANNVTVASAGGTIDGAATQSLTSQYAVQAYVSDGSVWWRIS